MRSILYSMAGLLLSANAIAATIPFDLSIKGGDITVQKSLHLSDVGEGKTSIQFDFKDKQGKTYNFDLKYKKLPANRSYPANLDITLKDAKGNKLGYLFFANNGVDHLKDIGIFGLVVDIDGKPVDLKFTFDADKKGSFSVAKLNNERFVQDTLVPKFNFQMIRPVIIPEVSPGHRSITYTLDDHPYSVNYTIKDQADGIVRFQHNLYTMHKGKQHLLEQVYFEADNLDTLRGAMYASKYFDENDGVFKLVFYPAMGQTQPKG